MRIKIDISVKVSHIVRLFILADVVLLAGWGTVAPIFSVFILQRVAEATLVTIGISSAIFWLVKSMLQIPIANFLDKRRDERMAFYMLIAGLVLISLAAFSFTLIRTITQLYLVQLLHALSMSLYIPAWSGMFSKHLDKEHYSLDWSLDSTAIGISTGITGAIGGILAKSFGFNITFILAGIASLLAIFTVISVPQLIFPGKPSEAKTTIKDHSPR